MKLKTLLIGLLAAGVLVPPLVHAVDPLTKLTHIHGLYFHSDGQLRAAGHHGILRLDNGRWLRLQGSDADLAGFSASRDALYASDDHGRNCIQFVHEGDSHG